MRAARFRAALLHNWVLAYAANAAGAILLAFAIHLSGVLDGNTVKATAIKIAEAKAQLDTGSAFLRGILCNMLVCLAVWLSVAARSVEGKAIAIAFPISAFVALGFEHCIANFYLLPIGMLSGAQVTAGDFLANIVPVTLGNTLGGVLVAAAYYAVYLGNTPSRDRHRAAGETAAPAKTIWRVSGSAGWPAVAAEYTAAKPAELPRPPPRTSPPPCGFARSKRTSDRKACVGTPLRAAPLLGRPERRQIRPWGSPLHRHTAARAIVCHLRDRAVVAVRDIAIAPGKDADIDIGLLDHAQRCLYGIRIKRWKLLHHVRFEPRTLAPVTQPVAVIRQVQCRARNHHLAARHLASKQENMAIAHNESSRNLDDITKFGSARTSASGVG